MLLAGNIGQFGAPGTVVVITGVVIATGLAAEDAGAAGFAAAVACPAGAAGACAVDAASVAGACAAGACVAGACATEQAVPAPVTATTAAAAAAARTLTVACLIGLRTVASWHGHSRHTRQLGEFGDRRAGCAGKRSKAGIVAANLQYSELTWRHAH
jgi:hypothetical protein